MDKVLESIKNAVQSALDWIKNLLKRIRKNKTEVEPEAREKKTIKQRVEELLANVKTKVEAFSDKVEAWFEATIDKIKAVALKVLLPVVHVFVPFNFAFAMVGMVATSAVMLAAAPAVGFIPVICVGLLTNYGLFEINNKLVELATVLMANEFEAYSKKFEADPTKIASAMQDPEFKKLVEEMEKLENADEDTVCGFSKFPKFAKFCQSTGSKVGGYGVTLATPIVTAVVCDPILKLSSSLVYGAIIPVSFGVVGSIVTVVPAIISGIAAYRCANKVRTILKTMANDIDTAAARGEAQKKAKWEARQEEERQRKYGKKGKK